MKSNRGFTLVEILVAITIVSILTGVISVRTLDANRKSRDTERQADLRILQSAIELYKNKYGLYPARCTPAVGAPAWSGQNGTTYECAAGQQYIVGLAPEFIPALPKDPRLNGANSGYVYTVNAARTVYKLMAKRTVESEVVTFAHPLKSCDMSGMGQPLCSSSNALQPPDPPGLLFCDRAMCDQVFDGSGLIPVIHCQSGHPDFQTTYAVWGGYASNPNLTTAARLTEDIVCEIP
jgi:prepilin-type N-terminal cleavage/methylation domain-containing protein